MAAATFDSLHYARQLEAAGMLREQPEVVAKGLTAMVVHNVDSLVTKDYLDTRFREFETRVESAMDKRFVEVDRRFPRIYLIFGITMVAVTIPVLQKFFG